jgi:hypothetical protein
MPGRVGDGEQVSARRTSVEARYNATLDFYETPAWATAAVVPYLPDLGRVSVLDPCAGRGAILDVLEAAGGVSCGIEWDPIRAALARSSRPVACGDALGMAAGVWRDWAEAQARPGAPVLVVMNPPFARAGEFVGRALAEVGPAGTVAALLRLAFLESKERAPFHRARPADVLVLSERPSFVVSLRCAGRCGWSVQVAPDAARPTACGACGGALRTTTSDSAAYAWFVWGPGCGGQWAMLERGASCGE